jgi:hypothetical protein
MARTFLSLVQQACGEIGITQPTSLFGNENATERQIIALSNREIKEFSSVANKNGGWQNLHKEYTFNTEFLNTTGSFTEGSAVITGIPSTVGLTADDWAISSTGFDNNTRIVSVDSATQITVTSPATSTGTAQELNFGKIAYSIPSDFEYFVDKTFWDNKFKWALIGPITAQEKQILRYGVIASSPRNKFYIRLNKIWLDPVPTDSSIIAYDYYSNAPVLKQDATYSSVWTDDNDIYILDEDVFIQGLKWRFLRSKGLDYEEEYQNYELDVQRSISRDGGSRDLSLNSRGYSTQFLNGFNVPETGYGNQ